MADLNNSEALNRVVELARKSVAATLASADGREFVVLDRGGNHGVELKEITPAGFRAALPPFISQRATFDEKQSFVDYVNSYKSLSTRLFAHLESSGGGKVVAVIDYHNGERDGRQPQAVATGAPSMASPCAKEHQVTYALRSSEEWDRWSGISGKLMEQAKFVRFLEENAADVSKPDGASILELAQDFSVARKVDFSSAVRLQSGDISFEYTQEAAAKSKSGAIEVPAMFELFIPVFFGESPMTVKAFLRWNIDDGKLGMGIELHRPVYVRQSLFRAIGQDITERTQAPLHYGQLN